ncbi:MAG: response regulator [Methyloligellaceae bacterium]
MTANLHPPRTEKVALTDDAPHILVVDDDHRIRDLLCKYLLENGFRVTTAEDSENARSAMRGLAFDLLILDVMMPGDTGFDLASEIRAQSEVPILMLTAKTETDDRIQGLELGVDDYLTKPFEPRELLLRVHNVLRRREGSSREPGEIRMGEFIFHIGRGELKRNDTTVKLTERERDLLRQFAQKPGTPIARHELATLGGTGSERAVDVQINRLRRKIEADPSNPIYLQTVRGKGYILHTE